ncbi:MAG: hypothetical protein FJZ96_14130, partial [Chloroflexi bacterium]|nr:hypothetical protein [Chloroflexota bacterium]
MTDSARRNLLIGLLATLWLLTLLVGYAYLHKPFSGESLINLAKIFWQVTIILLLTSLAGGIGYVVLKGRAGQPVHQAVAQAALGYGVIATATYITGATVGLSWLLLATPFVLSAALLQKSIRGWWSSLGRVKGWLARAGWFEKCISLVTLVL